MIGNLNSLPLQNYDMFIADKRNSASAESYLRRCLEALLDLGRHILAKGFGQAVGEYKEIAKGLSEQGILNEETCKLLITMAGYRNRMVHFYNEISDRELFDICSKEISDIEKILNQIIKWIEGNPDMIDNSL